MTFFVFDISSFSLSHFVCIIIVKVPEKSQNAAGGLGRGGQAGPGWISGTRAGPVDLGWARGTQGGPGCVRGTRGGPR